jgi:hypothetical protein
VRVKSLDRYHAGESDFAEQPADMYGRHTAPGQRTAEGIAPND